ncbi:MAG: hypothetical protein C5B51_26345 [Terriglobia bacterium]|nr:MAG: hypothetical protein C5B51_26345 [Terriglobia bacterium]
MLLVADINIIGSNVKPGITAIIFGAMLFVLGMMPRVLIALVEGLRNLQDHIAGMREQLNNHVDLGGGDIWLVVGGGLLMIAGSLALLIG